MNLKPAKIVATIVLVGPVNPAMFHPEWFKNNSLIKPAEADGADVRMVSSSLSSFKSDWLDVDVRPERIQLRTQQEPYFPVLRDLALGCLNCLPRVPFSQVGINWEFSFKFPDSDSYHAFGHLLAPKEPWGELLKEPGMLGVAMQAERTDGFSGTKNYSVRPDLTTDSNDYTVIFSHNDHYSFEGVEALASPELAIDCIEGSWEKSRLGFEAVVAHLLRGV